MKIDKKDFDECIKSGVEQAMKDCELTIGMTLKEVVEKQIPKKIIRVKLRPSEYGSEYRCPMCESDLIPTEFFNEDGTEHDEKITWCSGCGQKLDWGESNG